MIVGSPWRVLNLWFWQSHIGLDFDLDGSIRARKRHLFAKRKPLHDIDRRQALGSKSYACVSLHGLQIDSCSESQTSYQILDRTCV